MHNKYGSPDGLIVLVVPGQARPRCLHRLEAAVLQRLPERWA
jgi:hypothetical protein